MVKGEDDLLQNLPNRPIIEETGSVQNAAQLNKTNDERLQEKYACPENAPAASEIPRPAAAWINRSTSRVEEDEEQRFDEEM